MFAKFSFFVIAAALSAATVQAQDLQSFQRSKGISEKDFNSLEALIPTIRMNAPASVAAGRVMEERDVANPRIIGGEPIFTMENEPWQVALIFASGPEPVRLQFCGGSLIRPTWIITAAHCLDRGTKPTAVDVIAGTAFYKNFGERLKVKRIVLHEGWDSGTMVNDVALIELLSPSTKGTPVELAAGNLSIAIGTNLRVTGWGALSEGGQGSEVLYGADIPTVGNAVCNSAESYGGRIKPSMMCAGLRDGGLDSCQGDSGGPAVVQTSTGAGRHCQLGIGLRSPAKIWRLHKRRELPQLGRREGEAMITVARAQAAS